MFGLLAARVGRADLVVAAIAAVGAVGCAQLAGIDNTEHAGNSVALTRTSIGAAVVAAPLELEGLAARYFVEDDPGSVEVVDATRGDDAGTWTSRLTVPAPIELRVPDPSGLPGTTPRLYAFPNQHLEVPFDMFEHPGRMSAPDGATFALTVPLDAAPTGGELFQAYVVGAWLKHDIMPTDFTVDMTQQPPALTTMAFSFTAAESVIRRAPIDRVTAQDALLVLRYMGNELTGVAEAPPMDQSDTATAVTTGPMTPVVRDQTLDLLISPTTLQGRYASVRPAVTTLTMQWVVAAAQGYPVLRDVGPLLVGPPLQSGTLAATEVGIAGLKYGNPFTAADSPTPHDWPTVFALTTFESRMFTLPGTTLSVPLFAGLNQFIRPEPGFALTVPAGLPLQITLGNTQLLSDGKILQKPTGFITASLVMETLPEREGSVLYFLQVVDLVPDMTGTALVRRPIYLASGLMPSFVLPADVFEVGHSYTLRAFSTRGGFPAAQTGDLVTRDFPLAQAYLDSGVFTVTP